MRLYFLLSAIFLSLPIVAAMPLVPTDSIRSEASGIEASDSIPMNYEMLNDLVVTATKKLVESDGAKLTYNVTEDPEAQSSPILDILRKVPGVSVDAEDNVKVNGQSNFKIFLNGREDPSLQGDVKNVLRAMPASTIKKIEVISDPGAKFEAEGTGGILNIVTIQRQRLEGFLGTINFWGGSSNLGASLSSRAKVKNVTTDVQVSYNTGSLFHKYVKTTDQYEYMDIKTPGMTSFRDARKKGRINDYHYAGIRLNTSWEPDTLNLFTLTGNLYTNPNHSNFEELTTGYDILGTPLWSFKRNTAEATGKYLGGTVQASYQHTFGKEGAHNLVLSYSYTNNGNSSDNLLHSFDNWNYPLDYVYTQNYSKGFSDTHIAQIDYSNPLNSHLKLEAGAKGSWLRNHNYSYLAYGGEDKVMTINKETALRIRQFRDVMAAYVSSEYTLNKWSARLGLRYEYTHMGLSYPEDKEKDFASNLNDLVPNASLAVNFTDASNLRLAYQMRIFRPSLNVLNPYRNYSTEGMVSYGNPDLKSQKMHNVYVSYSNYEKPLSGTVKFNYMYNANMITDFIFMADGLVNSTYGNVGKDNELSLEINLTWQPIKSLNLNLYDGLCYTMLKAESELLSASRNYWYNGLNLSGNYQFPCKVRLSAWGGFQSPWKDLQYESDSQYYYGVGVSRTFLKEDALQLSLNLSNVFPSHRKQTYTQTSESVKETVLFRYPQWYVGIGVSYRLGGLKAQVKRTAAQIESDAEASGSNKGQ